MRSYATQCGRYMYESFTGPQNQGDYECDPEGEPLLPKGMRKVDEPKLDTPDRSSEGVPPTPPTPPPVRMINEDIDSRIIGLTLGCIFSIILGVVIGVTL